jgi:hypothetical protein
VAWRDEHAVGIGRLARAEQHTDQARSCRTTWDPTRPAVINAADSQAPGIAQDEGGHSTRHRGERPGGSQVYPVTSEPRTGTGEMLLHRTIRPRPQPNTEPNVMICAVASPCC